MSNAIQRVYIGGRRQKAQPSKSRLSMREYLAIYVSLVISVFNFLLLFHAQIFGPDVDLVDHPKITLYHQGCYRNMHLVEFVAPLAFANNSLSSKDGIIRNIEFTISPKSGEDEFRFMFDASASISGDVRDEKLFGISTVITEDREFVGEERTLFCDGGSYTLYRKRIKGNPDVPGVLSVKSGGVSFMNVKTRPIHENKTIRSLDLINTILVDVTSYRLSISYTVVNDGFLDGWMYPLQKYKCEFVYHKELAATYLRQGWVDVALEDCG